MNELSGFACGGELIFFLCINNLKLEMSNTLGFLTRITSAFLLLLSQSLLGIFIPVWHTY